MMIVLNIGCGPREPVGALGRGTVWPQATEIGIDLDPETRPDVVADMRALPFRDECFYGIIASHVLEHISMEGVKPSLEEMRRVLRPQGTLEIRVPDMRWVAERIIKEGLGPALIPVIYGDARATGGHLMGFDPLSLVAFIRSAGFQETGVGTGLMGVGWWEDGEDLDKVEPGFVSNFREIKLRARKK